MTFFTILFLLACFVGYNTIIIVPMREAFVIERLGKFRTILQPGLHFLIPFFDRIAYKHETREQIFDIASQSCISSDNMQISVDGLVYLKVNDPEKASYGIEDYRLAAINMAQTTMRSEVGKLTLGQTFSERDLLNEKIVKEIDKASTPWGIKVLRYEIKNIRPSNHVIQTLEKQMEAERSKRAEITLATATKEAKVLRSEGERQESINISEGEKQKRINESVGKAKQIELIATATAKGIAMVADAIKTPGGDFAIKMQLADQFIDELGGIMSKSDISVLPNEMANIKGVFEGFSLVGQSINLNK